MVAADHFLGGLQWIQSVFGAVVVTPWSWVGFTGWVLFEDTILALWIWESLRLTSGMAFHQAEQQLLHETIEREVAEHIDALHQENIGPNTSRPTLSKARPSSDRWANLLPMASSWPTPPASGFTATRNGCPYRA